MSMINEDELAKEILNLEKTVEPKKPDQLGLSKVRPLNLRPELARPVLTPTGMAKAVEAATNEDTDRATRTMNEQMDNIISGLERDISETEEVRLTIVRRIDDLNIARQACIAAKEVLQR
jgi:hypothetical protein